MREHPGEFSAIVGFTTLIQSDEHPAEFRRIIALFAQQAQQFSLPALAILDPQTILWNVAYRLSRQIVFLLAIEFSSDPREAVNKFALPFLLHLADRCVFLAFHEIPVAFRKQRRESRNLFIIHRQQQLDDHRHAASFNGVAPTKHRVDHGQNFLLIRAVAEDRFQRFEKICILGQLRGSVPVEQPVDLGIEIGTLCLVHLQIVAHGPACDAIEVVVNEFYPTATGCQGKRTDKQDGSYHADSLLKKLRIQLATICS